MFSPLQPSGHFLALWRLLFAIALAASFAVAVSPAAMSSGESQADKAAHFFAFYGLTLMAVMAFPKASLLLLGALMSGYGAVIEIAQGLPIVGRDRDSWDWIADTLGSAAALAPLILVRSQGRQDS